MVEEQIVVGLVVECRLLGGTWGGHLWRPVAVLETPPETASWTRLSGDQARAVYYAGAATLHLYSTDTGNYRDNLESGAARIWVVLRGATPEPPAEIVRVTADPAEGEACTEAGSDSVETLDLPAPLAERIAAFVAQHHVERPVIKRKRERAEPDAGRRGSPPGGRRGHRDGGDR